MSHLKLSQRLRVYAAMEGETKLTLTHEQAVALIRICERLEDNNADHEAAMKLLNKHRASIDRMQWLQEMNEAYMQWFLRVVMCVALAKELINIGKALFC